MASAEVARRMDALSTPTKLLLVEFLAERLEQKQKDFMRIPETEFKTHRGRCLELEALILYLEGNKR